MPLTASAIKNFITYGEISKKLTQDDIKCLEQGSQILTDEIFNGVEVPQFTCGNFIVTALEWKILPQPETKWKISSLFKPKDEMLTIDKLKIINVNTTDENSEMPKKCPVEPGYEKQLCEYLNEDWMQSKIEPLVRKCYGSTNVKARKQMAGGGFPDIVVYDSPAHNLAKIVIEIKGGTGLPYTREGIYQVLDYTRRLHGSKDVRRILITPGKPHPFSKGYPEIEYIEYNDAIKRLKNCKL
jgi:hypothetical protein